MDLYPGLWTTQTLVGDFSIADIAEGRTMTHTLPLSVFTALLSDFCRTEARLHVVRRN